MSRPPPKRSFRPPNTDGTTVYAVIFKTYEPLLGNRTRETDFDILPDRYGLTFLHSSLPAANAAARQIALFGTPENDYCPNDDEIHDGEQKTKNLRYDKDYIVVRATRDDFKFRESGDSREGERERVEEEEIRVRYVKMDWDVDGCLWYDVEFEAVREILDSYGTDSERGARRYRRDPIRKVVAYVKKMHVTDDTKRPMRNVIKQNINRFMPRDWRPEVGDRCDRDIKVEKGDESPSSDVFNKLAVKLEAKKVADEDEKKSGLTGLISPPAKTARLHTDKGTQTAKTFYIAPIAPKKRDYTSISVQVGEMENETFMPLAPEHIKPVPPTEAHNAPIHHSSSTAQIAAMHHFSPNEAHHGPRKTTLEEYIRSKGLSKAKTMAAPEGTSPKGNPMSALGTNAVVPHTAQYNGVSSVSDPHRNLDTHAKPKTPQYGFADASASHNDCSPRLPTTPSTPTLTSRVPPAAKVDGSSPKRRKPTYAMSALHPVTGSTVQTSAPASDSPISPFSFPASMALEPNPSHLPPTSSVSFSGLAGLSTHTLHYRHTPTPPPADSATATRTLTHQLNCLNSFLRSLQPLLTASVTLISSQDETTRNREAHVAHLQNMLKQKEVQAIAGKEWLELRKKDLEMERDKLKEERERFEDERGKLKEREAKLEGILKGLKEV